MEELEASTKYVPTFELIDHVRKEEKAIRVENDKRHKEAMSIKKQELLSKKDELKEAQRQPDYPVFLLLEKELHVEQIAEVLDIPIEEVKKICRRKPKS